MLAGARCPQLCAYRGAWVVGHQLWVALELLEGGSLASLISPQQPLPERVAARVTRGLELWMWGPQPQRQQSPEPPPRPRERARERERAANSLDHLCM